MDMNSDLSNAGSLRRRRPRLGRWELLAAVLVVAGLLALLLTAGHAEGQGPALSADLAVTQTDSPDPVRTERTLTYEITVNDLGPDAATNVVVTDKLPSSVDYVASTPTQGTCAVKGNKLTCELGGLTADATVPYEEASTASITVRVKAPRKAGSISNTAKVSSDVGDPNGANDSATEETTVVAGGQPPTCAGVRATIVGTPGNDELSGTPGRDVIVAGDGNDTIASGKGRDLICAGAGADLVRSGGGRDTVIAGGDEDFVRAGGGPDRVSGRGGDDSLRGQRGDDNLRGGRGNDGLAGGPGHDRCGGGPGDDALRSCED
jgi:uncharacterized repeat protein (TIGR01451 family)